MLESLFNKVSGKKACNSIEKDSNTGASYEYCEIFKSIFYRTSLVAALSKVQKEIITKCDRYLQSVTSNRKVLL